MLSGLEIVGEAGTGTNVAVYREKKASDVATLNALAAKYLAELNTDARGTPVTIPIDEGYNIYPGDTIAITNAQYNISGTLRFFRVAKKPTRIEGQLEKAKTSLEQIILDVRKYQDLGIYPNQPSQITPLALNLQGLQGLYHLNEGEGTTAKNSAPDAAADGEITNGYWVQGSLFKYLNFDADGYVDCGDGYDVGGLEECAVGIACSPEEAFANANYLIAKLDQVVLQLYGTENKLRFAVRIGGSYRVITADISSVELFGRLVAFGVYTGSMLQLYVNGKLVKEQAQTGAIDSSSYNTFIGSSNGTDYFFHGAVAEAMLWRRKLSAQEVQELYFFPLARVVKRGGVPGWDVIISSTAGGTTDPAGEQHVDPGESLQVTAEALPGYAFVSWLFDGEDVGTDNPITLAAQDDGSSHSLVAQFQVGLELPPVYSGVMMITQTQGFISPSITEEATCENAPKCTEAISETPACAINPTVWTLVISMIPGSSGGSVAPSGVQTAGSGSTISVTASVGQFWAIKTSNPWMADGAVQTGTWAANRSSNTYVFPAQALGTTHQLTVEFQYGWELVVTGSTADGTTDFPAGGNSVAFTKRATDTGGGEIWDGWFLDTVYQNKNSTFTVLAQTAGTSHTLEARFHYP